jgi:mannose-6-phosphate isomerase-like protein (cupin superfamily)
MRQKFFWNPEDIIKESPFGPDEPVKWVFLDTDCRFGTPNVAQIRGGIREHTHDDHDEFIYTIRGEVEFTVGGVTRIVKAGDLLTIPAGVRHKATILSPDTAGLSIYSPFFDKDNPDRHFTDE